ncbi:MAG: hypothetical protein PVH19_10820 [Planctomycetia bacterium]
MHCLRDFAENEQELLDIFKKIEDKSSLEAADPELRAVLAKLATFKLDMQALDEEFYGSDPSVEAQQALSFRLNEISKELKLTQLGEDIKKEKARVNAIPGATEYLKKLSAEVAKEEGVDPNYLQTAVLMPEEKAEPEKESKEVEGGSNPEE